MRIPCLLLCAATIVPGPAEASELRDTTFGYSVSPPEFAEPKTGAVFTRLNVFAPPDTGFASNMGMMVQEMAVTRDQFVDLTKAQFEAAGMKVRSSSKRTVSGQPAVVFDYEGEVRGHALRFLALAVILPERVLLLTYTAPVATYPALEKEFKRSLETFKLAR